MNTDAILTAITVAGVLVVLIRQKTSPALAVMGGTITLMAMGVISSDQALAGFSNPAPITIAALYVVAAAVEKTGALAPVLQRTMGSTGYARRPLLRMGAVTATASAFLNNTPILAMLIPQVTTWAERHRISVSKLLMPLSFAAILGGTTTLIGTSTNLVVAGQAERSGIEPLGFFEFGRLGLPIALVGFAIIVAIGPSVLPGRRSVMDEMEEDAPDYVVQMRVVEGGPIDGQTVKQAQLRDLEGLYLTRVDRSDSSVAPVPPGTVLRGGNRLHFSGRADVVLDLANRRGLESAESEHMSSLDPRVQYYEAVIGARSPLVGSTLAEIGFRGKYQAAVVAIHRAGQLVDAKLGTVPLKVGDTLILVSDPDFRTRWKNRSDFLLIAQMDGSPPVARSGAVLAVAVLACIVILAATGLVPILYGSLVGAAFLVAANILTANEARLSIDMEVIIVIAAAFGLAAAMEISGLAQGIADVLVNTFGPLGDRGVLLGIVLATIVLTELITNNAAALLMFPIGLTVATQTDLNPTGVAIAIAVSASASFLTPIGYQTNTMVYGPGGYHFSDYARLGAALSVVVVIMTVWLVPILW